MPALTLVGGAGHVTARPGCAHCVLVRQARARPWKTKTVRVVPWRTVRVGVAHGRYVLIRQARLIDAVMALQGRYSQYS